MDFDIKKIVEDSGLKEHRVMLTAYMSRVTQTVVYRKHLEEVPKTLALAKKEMLAIRDSVEYIRDEVGKNKNWYDFFASEKCGRRINAVTFSTAWKDFEKFRDSWHLLEGLLASIIDYSMDIEMMHTMTAAQKRNVFTTLSSGVIKSINSMIGDFDYLIRLSKEMHNV